MDLARHAPHVEVHRGAGAIRDVVVGMSDGLTVPFALAAGISGAVASTGIVVTAGLAEIAAGSIAMGLGGYLATKSEEEHYQNELAREEREVVEKKPFEEAEVRDVLTAYGIPPNDGERMLDVMRSHPRFWVDFMMKFELGLHRDEENRGIKSALTIGGAYVVGGLFPLLPYMLTRSATTALVFSVVLTMGALAIFGFVKGKFTGAPALRSAMQTTVVGAIAAGAAFGLAKLISH